MSDQPNITPPATAPPSTQSLDEILNQLEKATGTAPEISNAAPSATPATPAPEPPPVQAEAAPVMPSEPASPPIADTTASDPAPVSDLPPMNEVTSSPAVESTPEPAPVATLPENDIPVPPPTTPSEPAPMVKEEPSLDMGTEVPVETPASEPETMPEVSTPEPMPTPEPVESAPIETPPEVPPSEPDVVPDPIKKSGGTGGKIIAGVIGVLLLAGAAGAGVFLTQQNQETRTPATTAQPVSQTKTVELVTPVPAALKGAVSGKICNPGTGGGTVFFYNLKDYKVSFVRVAAGQGTYTNKLVFSAPYVAFYQPEGSTTKYGYTGTDKKLKTFSATDNQPLAIDLCDGSMDTSSVPTEQFTLGE